MSHDHHHEHHAMAPNIGTTEAPRGHHDKHTASGHDHSEGHMMKMWFHGGVEEVILFDWWRTESFFGRAYVDCKYFLGLAFSCVIIFMMAAFYEGIKWVRVYLTAYANQRQRSHTLHLPSISLNSCQNNEEALIPKVGTNGVGTLKTDEVYKSTVTVESRPKTRGFERLLKNFNVVSKSPISAFRLLQATLYCIQLTLAYWLMLVAMTYNFYLTAMVVLGASFGHWLFYLQQDLPTCMEKQDVLASDACH